MEAQTEISDAAGGPGVDAHVWRIAVVVVLGSIMSVLDTTIVNVALDALHRGLHTSLVSVQWVVTGYLLALAAVIPVTGWAARRYGGRRLYLLSLVLFTAGSVLCGMATTAGELVAFRVLQGIGGGMILPIGQTILVKAAGRRNLPRVMSAISVPVIMGPIVGPTIGGLLLQHAGWRWIFYVNLPVGIVAVVAGLRLLPADPAEEAGRLDGPGLLLAAAGLVGVTYGLAELGVDGTLLASTALLPLVGGVVLIALFVLRALRIPAPLLDLRLYASRSFSAASITTVCFGAALFGGMILMPLYFQTVRGQDAVATGLLLAPQGIGMAAATVFAGRAMERYGAGLVALVGGLVTVAGTLPFAFLRAGTSFWFLGSVMVVRGAGMGMCMLPAFTAAFTALRPEQVNDASPQLIVLQRVGGSIGTAILTVVLQTHLNGAGGRRGGEAAAFAVTYWWVVAITAAALAPTAFLALSERAAKRGAPDVPGVVRPAVPVDASS